MAGKDLMEKRLIASQMREVVRQNAVMENMKRLKALRLAKEQEQQAKEGSADTDIMKETENVLDNNIDEEENNKEPEQPDNGNNKEPYCDLGNPA
jgi:hypothetical protein